MSKASTYYFIGLILLNTWIQVMVYFVHLAATRYFETEGGLPPDLANIFMSLTWWPAGIAALAVFGFILSISTSLRSSSLLHLVIGLLAVDSLVFPLHLLSMLAISPMVPTT
jgi:hypothetical protein